MTAFMVWFGGKALASKNGAALWGGVVQAAAARLRPANGKPELSDEDLPARENR